MFLTKEHHLKVLTDVQYQKLFSKGILMGIKWFLRDSNVIAKCTLMESKYVLTVDAFM